MQNRIIAFLLCLLFSHSAFAALSVDGSGAVGTTTAVITTSNNNDIIVVYVYYTAVTTGSVSGGSLTWAKRKSSTSASVNIDEWWALAASPLSSVTITPSGYVGTRTMAAAVSGADLTTPFDTNVSLPAIGSGTGGSSCAVTGVSTTNANTILLDGIGATSSGIGTKPAGFSTLVAGNSVFSSAYNLVSATQSSITVTWTGLATTNACVVDAIQQASAVTTQDMFFRSFP